MATVSLLVNGAWLTLSAWLTVALAVVVITDLHVGAGLGATGVQPQLQPPSSSFSSSSSVIPVSPHTSPAAVSGRAPDHLVQVRVTSGRFGGRFFYRVSETNIPSDLYTVVLPLSFMHHHLPYPLIRAPARPAPVQQLPITEAPDSGSTDKSSK